MRALAALVLLLSPVLPSPPQEDGTSTWRAVLVVGEDGEELPFGLELGRGVDGSATAVLVNPPERIGVPVVEWDGKRLLLEMPHYDSRIRAELVEDELRGTWEKVRGADKLARVPFRARRGFHDRFALGASEPPVRVDGRWTVAFSSDELPAVAVFRQEEGAGFVAGTFLTATGDYRYLAGSIDGRELRLSCFDGAHAFLFHAALDDEGRLAGDFRSGNWWRETWTAERDPEASLGDAFAQTSWVERISFADLVFPDLDGELRSLAAPEYAGRAHLVQLFGSWCPNCHDEAPYLVELHERYAERGLSILGLAFELTGDFERDREQVRVYAERYGVEYPLFVAGTADKGEATLAFGAVDRVRSYPTTIFLHGDGRVRAVHSGFAGPATGAEHEALRAEFEALIEELLTEEPASDAATWSMLTDHPWFTDASFAGTTVTFREGANGEREAQIEVHGSGVRTVSEETVPVEVRGDAVWLGDELWRLDRAAGVLVDPRRFGVRFVPADGPVDVPLLAARGVSDEAGAVALLSDRDPLVRREAIVLLVTRRRPRANASGDDLVPLLGDESLEVRVAAAWGAGQLHVAGALDGLEANLEHPHAGLRLETVRALARISQRDPDALLLLKTAQDDPVLTIRVLAEDALSE